MGGERLEKAREPCTPQATTPSLAIKGTGHGQGELVRERSMQVLGTAKLKHSPPLAEAPPLDRAWTSHLGAVACLWLCLCLASLVWVVRKFLLCI